MSGKDPLVLAISSVSRDIEVALAQGGAALSEHFVSDAGAENIMEYADVVLKASSRTIREVSLVAVAIGPGSYGGLRGGLASAKGVAQSLNVPLVAVPSLEAVAYNVAGCEALVAVAVPAMKDEYNFALFGLAGGEVKRITEDLAATEEALARSLSKVDEIFYLASQKSGIFDRIKKINPGSKVRAVGAGNCFPRARSVAALGLKMFGRGDKSDVLSLVPTYSHDPNIREFGQKRSP